MKTSVIKENNILCPPREWENLAAEQAEMLDEASKACLTVEGHKERTINLQACILYDKGDITGVYSNPSWQCLYFPWKTISST